MTNGFIMTNVLVYIAMGMLAAAALLPWLIRRAYRIPRIHNDRTPAGLDLPYRECRIPTANGKRLAAWLIGEDDVKQEWPLVLIIHGWGGSAGQMLLFASLLFNAGYRVLLLNARNHGDSDEDSFSSMPRFAEDLEHGLTWARSQPGTNCRRVFLLGHSVGAAAALLVASRRKDLAGVISISSFCHPAELMRRQMRSWHIPYIPAGWLILRYVEKTIGVSLDHIAPCRTIHDISCPVLLLHGRKDRTVPSADAERIHANRGGQQVRLVLLENTGHDSIDAIDRHGHVLIDFLSRCPPAVYTS